MFEDLFTPWHMVVFCGFLATIAAIFLFSAIAEHTRDTEPWMRDGRIAALLRERRRLELEALAPSRIAPPPAPEPEGQPVAAAATAGDSSTK